MELPSVLSCKLLQSIVKVYKKKRSKTKELVLSVFSYRLSAADFHGPNVYCNYANVAALIGRRKGQIRSIVNTHTHTHIYKHTSTHLSCFGSSTL